MHAFENCDIATVVRVEAPHSFERASWQGAETSVVLSMDLTHGGALPFPTAPAQLVLADCLTV